MRLSLGADFLKRLLLGLTAIGRDREMKSTKIRAFIAGVVAIVLVVIMASVASAKFEWNIPVLRDIGNAIVSSSE